MSSAHELHDNGRSEHARFCVSTLFTTRDGGVSVGPYASLNLGHHVGDAHDAVSRNRKLVARSIGRKHESIIWMDQQHTTTVRVVDRRTAVPVPCTDGIVTTDPAVVLAVLVADCVPVLLADEARGVIAAVHAGRVGAAGEIVPAAIAAMRRCGAHTASIRAWLGPAISGEYYEVPAGLASEVEAALPGSACTTSAGTPGLDIRAGLVEQLRGMGVTDIACDPRCTASSDEFFSYRREMTTGRQAGLIWLTRNE